MKRLYWIGSGALLVGIITLSVAWLHKTVTITIDSQSQKISTWAFNVKGLLAGTHIPLGEADIIQPGLSTVIHEGQTIQIKRARWISVEVDGRVHSVLSAERIPAYWLAQSGIALLPNDLILINGEPVDPFLTTDAQAVQILHQRTINLVIDGQAETIKTTASTLAQALWQAGITLSSNDFVEPALQTTASEGLHAVVRRARLLKILLADSEISFSSSAQTVSTALADAGVIPQGLDYTLPAESDAVPQDGIIRLVRVRDEIVLEQTPISFETRYEATSDLEIDNQKVLQAGEPGMTIQRTRVRFEDGQEQSRQVEQAWTARAAQDRIIGYGTQIVQRTIDTPDGPITYWRALTMYATSYHPAETGGNITASGLPLRKGLVGVDPRYIPYFTRLYVPGYGEAIAADTGGGIWPRLIDLAYPDAEYIPWHKYVTVYFLWPPPDKIVYVIP